MRSQSLPITTSATLSWISSREPAQQTCPWLKKMPLTIPSTAWSSAASSKITFADLPPSSSVSETPRPASAAWMSLPTAVEPVNATLSMSGSRTSAAPAAPSPGHDRDDAGRQLRLLEDLGEDERGQRRRLGRLQHAGVAAGERGRQLPGGHQQREVPGHDLGGDAERRGLAAADSIRELVGPARVVEEVRRGQRHVHVARLADRLAAVHRLDDRELTRTLLDQARDPEEVLAALEPAQRGPARLGRPCRLDRARAGPPRRRRPPRRAAPPWPG